MTAKQTPRCTPAWVGKQQYATHYYQQKPSIHYDEEPYNNEFCANLGQ